MSFWTDGGGDIERKSVCLNKERDRTWFDWVAQTSHVRKRFAILKRARKVMKRKKKCFGQSRSTERKFIKWRR